MNKKIDENGSKPKGLRAETNYSNNNTKVDTIQMIEFPEPDYDSEEPEPDSHHKSENSDEPHLDEDEDEDPNQIDGLEVEEQPHTSQIRNRFKSNNGLPKKNQKLTMRTAKQIAKQMGLMNDQFENQQQFINYGFNCDARDEEESISIYSIVSVDGQKRQCWAKSCSKTNCEIHSFMANLNDDNPTIENLHNNRRYKNINSFKDRLSEFWSLILIWSRDLRQIEATYGTGIVSYFHFLRWLLFINLLICLSVVLIIIIPQTLFIPISTNSTNPTNSTKTPDESLYEQVLDFFQGMGWMENTLTFIGYYQRKIVRFPLFNWNYNITLSYIVCTVFYFCFCFVLMLQYTTVGMRDTLLAEHHQQYSSMIFCGWDFCTQDVKRFKQSIAMEIKNAQDIDKRKEKALNRAYAEKVKIYAIRFVIFIIVAIILGASFYAIGLATESAANFNANEDNEDVIKNIYSLIMEYSPTLVIFALYMIVPEIFVWLIKYERYDNPETVIKITLMRMVFLKMSSLMVLLISLFNTISNNNILKDNGWENYIGQTFYKLMMGDMILEIFMILIIHPLRKLMIKKDFLMITKILDEQQFDIPRNVLSLVYIQALCWLGTFYCPAMPIICIFRMILLFYAQKFTLVKNCQAPDQAYRASRSNIIFILILIIAYFISVIPIAYSIGSSSRKPSLDMTPFADYEYIWQPIEQLIEGWYDWTQTAVNLITSTASTLIISFFLCLLTYYYYVRGLMHKRMIDAVHSELKELAQDRVYLIDQLSLINIRLGLKAEIN